MKASRNDDKGNRLACIRKCLLVMFLFGTLTAHAQNTKTLTLKEAIQLGLENSKTLQLSRAKVDEAISRYEQVKDNALPTAKASYAYNHAEIPTNTLKIGAGEPIRLPSRADAFIGTVSVQELIFAGNKLKYARESSNLLSKIAQLDVERDADDIVFGIVNSYYNLYRVQQSAMVVKQNLESVNRQLTQANRFFEQGIVTKNDVLRFQIQKNDVEITGIDLENNRKIVNYDLNLLLGLPENTQLNVSEFSGEVGPTDLEGYLQTALASRSELKESELRARVADAQIKSIHADQLPTIGVGANLYYINTSGNFFPPANTFIAPVSLGATVAWNFDKLWTNKNRIAEAKIQRAEADIARNVTTDRVKTDVNRNFQNYLTARAKIAVYESSVNQATENDKILESKYKNTVASVTDRIDAGTQLFQSQINLELAKADAALAWYALLKSSGKINPNHSN